MKYFSYICTSGKEEFNINKKIMAQNTLIYPSHYELMEELTDEQAGLLIKTIGRYQRGEDISISDVLVKGIWMGIKSDFDKQRETYEAVCKRNQENGKKGGRPKKTQKTQVVLEKPNITQLNPKNLKDKDKDKDINKDKNKVNSKSVYTKLNFQSEKSFAKSFNNNMTSQDVLNYLNK